MNHYEWAFGILITLVIGFVTIAMALKKTFVFRDEYKNHKETCRKILKKNDEIHERDLEMRDQAITRLEQKIDSIRVELKEEIASTKSEFRENFYHVKNMLQAVLTKMNISDAEVGRS